MTRADHNGSEAQGQAADWVARLGGEPLEADWLAFELWLEAAPGNRAAYDRMLALSLEVEARAPDLVPAQAGAPARAAPERRPRRAASPVRRPPTLWWSAGLMAVAAAAVTFAVLNPRPAPEATVYATGKGERRNLVLADGTQVALDAASRISVVIDRGRREITLASGEAAFRVTHDPDRPLTVQVGDRVLRDIGTEFDVLRRNGLIAVTVREGMVAVQAAGDDSRSLSLGPGGRLEHREGAPGSTVLATDPDEAFAWRAGRLIYRNRRLAEVAADLSRYGQDEVRVSGPAADLRFSGVLTIDSQPEMVERLTGLLPSVSAHRKDGAIVLSELNTSR